MNKLRYRIIFNKVRGMLMVVSETASSRGKAVGEGGPGGREAAGGPMPALLGVTAAIALAFGACATVPAAQAQGRSRPRAR